MNPAPRSYITFLCFLLCALSAFPSGREGADRRMQTETLWQAARADTSAVIVPGSLRLPRRPAPTRATLVGGRVSALWEGYEGRNHLQTFGLFVVLRIESPGNPPALLRVPCDSRGYYAYVLPTGFRSRLAGVGIERSGIMAPLETSILRFDSRRGQTDDSLFSEMMSISIRLREGGKYSLQFGALPAGENNESAAAYFLRRYDCGAWENALRAYLGARAKAEGERRFERERTEFLRRIRAVYEEAEATADWKTAAEAAWAWIRVEPDADSVFRFVHAARQGGVDTNSLYSALVELHDGALADYALLALAGPGIDEALRLVEVRMAGDSGAESDP